MIARDREVHLSEICFVGSHQTYRLTAVLDNERSVASRAVIQTPVSGKIDYTDDRFSVDREPDLDRKIAVLFYKAPGAVDRVRDPDSRRASSFCRLITLLFRENEIAWK